MVNLDKLKNIEHGNPTVKCDETGAISFVSCIDVTIKGKI